MSDEMDNVEWLRKSSSDEWCGSALNKCADEIERLREENARLREALKPFSDRLDELEKMKASKYACATSVEIEHLRAAAAAIREGGKDA